MDATTGEVAGASVQIGDPVTEKLLIDVLVGAEHLFTAVTDCGAGGLSSAVGEMADGVGADVELDLVPLKYAGLEPWEIWLSEAQERMVVAVAPDRLAVLRARCEHVGVEIADLGAFTGDGRLVVRSHGDVVLDLDTTFLHEGRPQRRMTAAMPAPDRVSPTRTSRRRRRRSTGTTTRSVAPRSFARSWASQPTGPPTASSSPSRAPTTASPWASG
jgi:phosphoribosylformylglycinamidine synthase subunit PurSL